MFIQVTIQENIDLIGKNNFSTDFRNLKTEFSRPQMMFETAT